MPPNASHQRDDHLFGAVFRRAYRFGRRWDEALWRYHELRAVGRLIAEQPGLLREPILDLGCGDGEVFEWLFGLGRVAVGLDSGATRPEDLDPARRRGCYTEVRLEDAARTTLADGQFRLVFSNSVVEHIVPIVPVLAQVSRILTPGGRLVFTTPHPRLYSADAYGWRRLLAPLGFDIAGRALARQECAVYRHATILDGSGWESVLREVGLQIESRCEYLPLTVASAMTLFSGASRLPVLGRFAWVVSPQARALSRPTSLGEEAWVDQCARVLGPFLATQDGQTGCGQLIVAQRRAGVYA